jgi:hypothetical protein
LLRLAQADAGGIDGQHRMALRRQPDAVAPFAIAGHQHTGGRPQAILGLRLHPRGIGRSAVFEVRRVEGLITECHGQITV